MATEYDNIEAGIQAVLMADDSPFRSVEIGTAHLSSEGVERILDQMKTTAPAAAVHYDGGDSNGGYAGALHETAVYSVLVVAAGTGRVDAGQDLYSLMSWTRSQLHNNPDVAGCKNPLTWTGNHPINLPGQAHSVAAFLVRFSVQIPWPDGPTS